MRLRIATILTVVLVLASCGNGGDTNGSNDATRGSNTADIDICALLSDEDISAAIGSAPPSEPTEPAGPFTGCKWGSGLLFVQIAASNTLITAPSEQDCRSPGIGEESTACPGSVKFLADGIHATISTIEDLTEAQMTAVAETLLAKLRE
jgi:hypothetical protein